MAASNYYLLHVYPQNALHKLTKNRDTHNHIFQQQQVQMT